MGISLEMASSRWLMCLFVTCLPMETSLRLWDLLLLDAATRGGCSAVPLVGCLSLLQLREAQLLAIQARNSRVTVM